MGNYNSTIISKKKRLKCGCFDFNFSHGYCKQHATVISTEKRMAEFEDKDEVESIQNLVQDLDVVYSIYIRTKEANPQGLNVCYTCGAISEWQHLDCGHFVPRANMATRFYPPNTKPQCPTCNRYKDGNIPAFELHLEKDEKGIVESLQEMARTVYKPTINELKSLIIEYRHKNELIKRKFK